MATTWGLAFERYIPLVGAGAATLASWLLMPEFGPKAQQLFASTVDMSAIAAGFLGTAKGLLLSFKGTPADDFLQKSGFSELLGEYIRTAAWGALLLAAFSLIVVGRLGLDKPLERGPGALWVGTATFVSLAVVRALHLFFRVFQQKTKTK